MLLLGTLGVAIGVSAIDPMGGAPGLGVGAAIWGGLTLLIAVFIGGMVAARLGLVLDQPTSALHGALVWVLSMLAVLYLATSGISLGVNALLGVAGTVAGRRPARAGRHPRARRGRAERSGARDRRSSGGAASARGARRRSRHLGRADDELDGPWRDGAVAARRHRRRHVGSPAGGPPRRQRPRRRRLARGR